MKIPIVGENLYVWQPSRKIETETRLVERKNQDLGWLENGERVKKNREKDRISLHDQPKIEKKPDS